MESRISAHHAGTIPGYTQGRRPLVLEWAESFGTRDEALSAERRIKGWSRAKKQALIDGDWDRLRTLARNRQDEG
jgi:predicted GIY-YIG superfamily endonuclease